MKKESFIISLCIPCKDRAYDLKETMPYIIKSANESPPVEVVVLDYDSHDDLEEYIGEVRKAGGLNDGNLLSYIKIPNKSYYHVAKVRNASVVLSKGKYIIPFSADIIPSVGFFRFIRDAIGADSDMVWMRAGEMKGMLVIRRDEFMAAGGYDERFELYGSADKDLEARLVRRGGKMGTYPMSLLTDIPTVHDAKVKNFRKLSKREMSMFMRLFYEQNVRDNVLVANEGKDWGKG